MNGGGAQDDDGEFLTLKRADHALGDEEEDSGVDVASLKMPAEQQMSKRKLQQGQSKKAMAAAGKRGSGDRVVFDDEGNARPLYELQDERAFLKQGTAEEQQRHYEELERQRMAEADIRDKNLARQKRLERKYRMKERERQLAEQERRDVLGPEADSDPEQGLADLRLPGEESEPESEPESKPESNESETSEESEERAPRPGKRAKTAHRDADSLAAQEEQALRLLSR